MKVEPTGRIHQYLEVRGQDPYALLFKLPNVPNGKSFGKLLFSSHSADIRGTHLDHPQF